MLRKLLIIGIALVLLGTSALILLSRSEAKWQQFKTACRNNHSQSIEGYAREYIEWLKLPEYQRNAPVWQDSDEGETATPENTRRKQYERFVADIDNLADIDPHLYPMARLLYGNDWKKKLENYNRKEELAGIAFAASVISSCLGTILMFTAVAGAGIRRIKKKISHCPEDDSQISSKVENTDEQKQQNDNENKKNIAAILNCPKYDAFEQIRTDEKRPQQKVISHKVESPQETPSSDDQTDESFFSSYRKIREISENIDRNLEKVGKNTNAEQAVAEQETGQIGDTLTRLTDEVAAIRHYAGQQQEKVKKLQEGYDWNIIRNFALRIIRCVDNIEKRIETGNLSGEQVNQLTEIKDELIFALESSGLERYEPKINSEYRGQEKTAEAVKDRKPAEDSSLRGRIADVIRCGYRYFVDEENFKVVRAAQVRLFG
jgi:molecular chaperone GrpE (heat shock protein)